MYVNRKTVSAHGDTEVVEVLIDARLLELAQAFADERGIGVKVFVPEVLTHNKYERRK
jgi:hypothetical protein